jgi:L,D-transpeptidase ErfK/SrfK
MLFRIFIPVFFSFLAVSVCKAEFQQDDSNVLTCTAPLENIEKTIKLPGEEYASIIETFAKANKLFSEGDIDEADKLCSFARQKYALFEKNLLAAINKDESGDTRNRQTCNKINIPIPVEKTVKSDPVPENSNPQINPLPSNRIEEKFEGFDKQPGTTKRRQPAGDMQIHYSETNSALPNEMNQSAIIDPDEKSGQIRDINSHRIIGSNTVYTVKKRESLRMVAAKLGVNWQTIAKENGLDPKKRLEPGLKLIVNTRKIIPKFLENGIVINIPDRTLYYFRNKHLTKVLPVGLGMKNSTDKVLWRTPTGKFIIVSKQKDPVWHVPQSIQWEMKQRGRTVVEKVRPGNRNPLGKYSLRTSLSGILIHSTIYPETVYGFSSHGCIRMLSHNMEELFNEIKVNTNGEIIYQPIKVVTSEEGRVFMEVHGDVYEKYKNLEKEVNRLIALNDATYKVDWDKIRSSLKNKSGAAEDITLERYSQQARQNTQ